MTINIINRNHFFIATEEVLSQRRWKKNVRRSILCPASVLFRFMTKSKTTKMGPSWWKKKEERPKYQIYINVNIVQTTYISVH